MAKVCIACGLVPPPKEPSVPMEEKEDCPGCGGKGTLQEVPEEKKEEIRKE